VRTLPFCKKIIVAIPLSAAGETKNVFARKMDESARKNSSRAKLCPEKIGFGRGSELFTPLRPLFAAAPRGIATLRFASQRVYVNAPQPSSPSTPPFVNIGNNNPP